MQVGVATPTSIAVGAVVAGFFALWIVALIDIIQRTDAEFPSRWRGRNDRLVWTFIVLFFSGLGALAYYIMVMRPYPRRRR